MLINIGDKGKSLLPKLKVEKSSSNSTPKKRAIADDTLTVKNRMKELFDKYNWRVVTDKAELLKFTNKYKELGIDTETTGLDLFKNELVGMSLGSIDECIYIPFNHKVGKNYKGSYKDIEDILLSKELYGFNAKFDMKALKLHAGISFHSKWCGYLAARLMNSAEPVNGLKDLYVKYIDPNDASYSFEKLFAHSFDYYDPEVVGGYAAVDSMKHLRLGKWQELNICEEDMKLMKNLEMPLTHDLVDIELRGIELDIEWCDKLNELLEYDLAKISKDIDSKYPGLNPGSPKQVAEWLYDKLGVKKVSGRGTGAAILERISHPLAEQVLEYRKVQKLISTYAGKMPKEADEGVIHTVFNQYGADTGRFSSSDPNLQNIPRDPRFRKMFKARDGHMLASCDYSQQEVYILASLADDETMKEAYEKGMDFYAYMASIVFDMPYENCIKGGSHGELRDQMKSIVLGLNYDMGVTTLAKDIGKSVQETRKIYDKFFEACPKIKTFRQERLDFAKKNGYVETILGRKRRLSAFHLPDFSSDDKDVEQFINTLKNEYAINKLIADAKLEGIQITDRRAQKAYETRQIVNSAVQGSAADMTKLAIVVATRDKKLNELGCKILLQVHDEIIAEFPEETAEEGAKRLAEVMIDVGSDLIGIQMKSTPKVMKSWE